MLSIKPIGSSTEQVRYYAHLGEDYYVTDGEAPGVYWGVGAEAIGVSGEVDPHTNIFRNLLLGLSPDGKRNLVQNAGDPKRRAGFDLTWSVPKSVSAAWSNGDYNARRRIEAANERALYKVLDTLQKLCGVTRRGKEGAVVEEAKLIGALFRHETARATDGEPPSPHLHHHLVLCNAVVREDGTTGAFDARQLFKKNMKMALGALYRAELSRELEREGLTSQRATRQIRGKVQELSWFELDCIPQSLIEELSGRHQEIEAWMKKQGLTGAKAAEKAALVTRKKKEHIGRDKLLSVWQEIGRRHGVTPEVVAKAFGDIKGRHVSEEIHGALTRAVTRLTESWSHFSELELLRITAEEAQARGIGIAEVKLGVSDALENWKDIVHLQEVDGDRHFTTREMLGIEKRMLTRVIGAVGDSRHKLRARSVTDAIGDYEQQTGRTLSGEKLEALRHITTGEDAVAVVQGYAGTLKTSILLCARLAWEKEGLTVLGTSLAARAARNLADGSGIQSVHLHKLFFELRSGKRQLTDRHVVVLDESSMVDTRLMDRLISAVSGAGAKLVLVGDHRQLAAIGPGAPFRGIAERVGCVELHEIMRQRDQWAKDAVIDFAEGNAESALAKYAERGLLFIGDDRDEALKKLIADWKEAFVVDPKGTLVFGGPNLDVTSVNRACQQARLDAGELGIEKIDTNFESLRASDRILFTKNKESLFVQNGTMGTVTKVFPERRALRVQIDGGLSIVIDTAEYDAMELAYCVTAHKGQGVTVENSFMLAGLMNDRELSYVQASRARGDTRIYTDLLNGGEDIAQLAKQMNRSRAKDLAIDYEME